MRIAVEHASTVIGRKPNGDVHLTHPRLSREPAGLRKALYRKCRQGQLRGLLPILHDFLMQCIVAT